MRRKALIVLLALGTVGGYAAGFKSMKWCHNQRRDAFEQHVASVCVDAARKSDAASARAAAHSQPVQQAPVQQAPVIVQVMAPAAQPAPVVPAAPVAQ